jgi:endogenous inhibitor of DNA gyrase (YacG/DUF329 family)
MRCPICKTHVEEPPPGAIRSVFPFCNDRCKLIDLGRWLDGKYQVPAVEDDSEEDDNSDSFPSETDRTR